MVASTNSGRKYLVFSDDEKKMAEEGLKRMGIPSNAKYVCIYNRDSAYLKGKFPGIIWDYHNIRDNDFSNVY